MTEADLAAFAQGTARAIKAALAPLVERIAVLEAHRTSSVTGVQWRGIWREGQRAYDEGALCTLAGSLWLAKTATTARPGTSRDWVLIVKSGQRHRDEDA